MQLFVVAPTMAILACMVTAVPKPEDERKHSLPKDLSQEEHFIESQHNPAYDHEAFLGEEAKTFDQLAPEESTRRLGIIVDKIDKDKDGYVTGEELKDWILYTQQKYIRDDVERQWKTHNPEEKEKISWTDYRTLVYGQLDETDDKAQDKYEDDGYSHVAMMKKERRRWIAADLDGDDALTKKEFTAFLHAEGKPHMNDVVVCFNTSR